MKLLADSKFLFDVISTGYRTAENHVMPEIPAASEGFCYNLILDIGFVRSSQNIEDGLTKPMAQATLRITLSTGIMDIKPEKWIIRN